MRAKPIFNFFASIKRRKRRQDDGKRKKPRPPVDKDPRDLAEIPLELPDDPVGLSLGLDKDPLDFGLPDALLRFQRQVS